MERFSDKARKAEKLSKWREAQRHWLMEGGDYGVMEANVCKTIADAIEMGDRYRELVADAHERWERHEINNRELHEIQCEAHKKVYGN